MINLLQNLGLQPQPAAAPPGPVERYPPHSPPPTPPAGRPVAQISSSSWVAPGLPREADICRECERQEPHICPYSERSSVSASSGGAVNPGLRAAVRLPLPGAPHQGRPANQQQLFPGDMCRECEIQQAHICLCSEKSSVSAGSSRRADMAGPPADPRFPPGASHLPCPVAQWVSSESGVARPEQPTLGAAGPGPSQHYAGSVVSSIPSRHGV